MLTRSTEKRVKRARKKFRAHDEENQYRVGDTVRIIETRPLVEDETLACFSNLIERQS